jgi:hypothetical protein
MARRGKGEGSIDERSDGRWRAYVTMPDGKRKYLYANTRKEIVRKLDKAKRDLERMGTLPDERLTVEDFLKAWLDGIAPAMRPQSMRRYRQAMEDHVIPVLGRRRLTQLIPEDLQRLYTAKLESGLSATTVRIVHFVLHRALRDPSGGVAARATSRTWSIRHGCRARRRRCSRRSRRARCSTRRVAIASRSCSTSRCVSGCGAASCWRCGGATSTSTRASSA